MNPDIIYSRHPITICMRGKIFTDVTDPNTKCIKLEKDGDIIMFDIQELSIVDSLMDKLLDLRYKITSDK